MGKEEERDRKDGGCAEDGRTVEEGRLHFRDPCSEYTVILRDVWRKTDREKERRKGEGE